MRLRQRVGRAPKREKSVSESPGGKRGERAHMRRGRRGRVAESVEGRALGEKSRNLSAESPGVALDLKRSSKSSSSPLRLSFPLGLGCSSFPEPPQG